MWELEHDCLDSGQTRIQMDLILSSFSGKGLLLRHVKEQLMKVGRIFNWV